MPDPRHVLVVAPNWLGDAVMALPAVGDVRRHFGAARMTVAARPAVAPVFTLAPAVDDVVTLMWRGGLGARAARGQDLERLGAVGAETAILLPNSFASAWLVKAAGVPERWGYATDFRRRLLSRAVRRPRRSMHQGAYYQHLVRQLGIDNGPLEPALEVPEHARSEARALLETHGWDGERPLLVIAPGAAYGTAKRWLPSHFAALIREMSGMGVHCALVGSGGDRPAAEWVMREASGGAVSNVCGETSLLTLAGVMANASACVSNDSGAMHLAGAVGAPLVALFGPTREYETAPLVRAGGRAEVLIHPVWCRPCMLRECPIDHRCMARLGPDRVAAAAGRLLRGMAS